MINKTNIPRPLGIVPDKLLVPFRPLVLGVPCQHALNTHADTLDILYGAPAGGAKKVQTDYPIGVNVWVDWDGAGEGLLRVGGRVGCVVVGCREEAEEDDFRWFYCGEGVLVGGLSSEAEEGEVPIG